MPSLPIRHRRHCLPRERSPVYESSLRASQREEECGPFSHRRLAPDTATVTRDDSLYGRQADPGALKIRILVETLEWGEEFVGISHIESSAIILDEENVFATHSFGTEHDLWLQLLRCELPGVSEQIYQDNRDETRVTLRRKSIGDLDRDFAGRFFFLKIGDHAFRQLSEADWFSSQ